MNNLTNQEQLVYDHMRQRPGQLIPYCELWSLGISFEAGNITVAGIVSKLRTKKRANVECVAGKGYVYHGEIPEEPKQQALFSQPDNRPRCSCGRPLYHGKCIAKECRTARQTIAAMA
jgi:hypothetical protein